jgi:hypothetical protein
MFDRDYHIKPFESNLFLCRNILFLLEIALREKICRYAIDRLAYIYNLRIPSHLQKGLFARPLRYAQNFILGGKHPSGMNFDSDILYMHVVKFFACLDFEPVSVGSENPNFAKAPPNKTKRRI